LFDGVAVGKIVSTSILGGHVNTSDDGNITGRRRRRKHSAEFKAKVVSACRHPGVSIAAVALANGLNANLLRRWVVVEERSPGKAIETLGAVSARSSVESPTFIPIQLESSAVTAARGIKIELRRGAMVVSVDWPLTAAADCAAWLRELLR
jgi:transposase